MDVQQPSTSMAASQYALRVALQTMKERCISLQKRLTMLEEENQQLREGNALSMSASNGVTNSRSGAAENFQLRLQLGEMQRQKNQLSEHISMVSNENRKLWSRLSQIAKEREDSFGSFREDDTLTQPEESPRTASATQNLIRSKTFTQHSPNPNLRHKPIEGASEMQDISLEPGNMANDDAGAGEELADASQAEMEMAYLHLNEDNQDQESSLEAKKCLDGLQDMRKEALKQQNELNAALVMLESKLALQPCPECIKKSQKPETADKSLETDDSLNEIKFYDNMKHIPTPNSPASIADSRNDTNAENTTASLSTRLNIIQDKIDADAMDKTCPMCGKIYNKQIAFDTFRQHVEMHFIDDNFSFDSDESMMAQNYEMISHVVGDF